jgi:hypothetical protein
MCDHRGEGGGAAEGCHGDLIFMMSGAFIGIDI